VPHSSLLARPQQRVRLLQAKYTLTFLPTRIVLVCSNSTSLTILEIVTLLQIRAAMLSASNASRSPISAKQLRIRHRLLSTKGRAASVKPILTARTILTSIQFSMITKRHSLWNQCRSMLSHRDSGQDWTIFSCVPSFTLLAGRSFRWTLQRKWMNDFLVSYGRFHVSPVVTGICMQIDQNGTIILFCSKLVPFLS